MRSKIKLAVLFWIALPSIAVASDNPVHWFLIWMMFYSPFVCAALSLSAGYLAKSSRIAVFGILLTVAWCTLAFTAIISVHGGWRFFVPLYIQQAQIMILIAIIGWAIRNRRAHAA